MDQTCDSCTYFLLEKYSVIEGICMFPVIKNESLIHPMVRTYKDVCNEWVGRMDETIYKKMIEEFIQKIKTGKYKDTIDKTKFEADYSMG